MIQHLREVIDMLFLLSGIHQQQAIPAGHNRGYGIPPNTWPHVLLPRYIPMPPH